MGNSTLQQLACLWLISRVIIAVDIGNDKCHRRKAVLDEDDELYLGYGFMQNVFPYRQQNNYNRELVEKEIDIIVLENNYLKASFLPTLGGRLWSLYDKVNNKELLYVNPVLRFGNLALRNAWFSGGVEWNVGAVGRSPFTCSDLRRMFY